MRSLVITQNITVDGAVEMLGDWFSAQGQGDQDDLLAEMAQQRATADALLLGRRTFEDMRGYWPGLTDDATGVGAYLDGVDKYVVSTTMRDPDWERTTVIDGDPVAGVRELTELDGGDIVVTGSIQLCHALVVAGLVDEYRLFVYPVVQGRGRGLFPAGTEMSLRLVESRAFRCGITSVRYRTRARGERERQSAVSTS